MFSAAVPNPIVDPVALPAATFQRARIESDDRADCLEQTLLISGLRQANYEVSISVNIESEQWTETV